MCQVSADGVICHMSDDSNHCQWQLRRKVPKVIRYTGDCIGFDSTALHSADAFTYVIQPFEQAIKNMSF